MLRFAVVVLAVTVLTLGLAAAKPALPEKPLPGDKPPPLLTKKSPKLDAAWSKQLTKHPAKVTVPDLKFAEPAPNFATVKRLDPIARGLVLQAPPEQVAGPIKFTVQRLFVDAQHYLELDPGGGTLSVRTAQNYAFFGGPDAVMASIFTRPRAFLHFRAEPGRRYVLECLVDVNGTTPGNISASAVSGPSYSVNTVDRASLLFVHTTGATAEQLRVELAGDRSWYLDGCELSWTGP